MKVAYVFNTPRAASYKLGKMILPQLEAGTHGVEVPVAEAGHQGLQDPRDLLFELVVQDELPLTETGHHLDRHVVGRGAQPAAREDHVHTLVGEEAQLRVDVLGAVTADRDVGELDAQLEQTIREPRAVAVLNPSRQDLRAGYDDASSCAHRP